VLVGEALLMILLFYPKGKERAIWQSHYNFSISSTERPVAALISEVDIFIFFKLLAIDIAF
jgi:hypothetical protein